MPLSLPGKQTIEELLENLPLDYQQTEVKSKVFLRARKIKSPMELMHLVMMYPVLWYGSCITRGSR